MHLSPCFALLLASGDAGDTVRAVLRDLGIFSAILGMVAVPLGLALWSAWDKQKLRAIGVPFSDQQAFLYNLGEGLGGVNFHRRAALGADGKIVFDPPSYARMLGASEITVDIAAAGRARIIGPWAIMRRVKRAIPGAVEEQYTGPQPLRRWLMGWAKAFGALLVFGLVTVGAIGLYFWYSQGHRESGSTDASGAAARGFDLSYSLTISAYDAAHGKQMDLDVASLSKKLRVKIPPGVHNGTQLRFRGVGTPPISGGPPGDLIVTLEVR